MFAPSHPSSSLLPPSFALSHSAERESDKGSGREEGSSGEWLRHIVVCRFDADMGPRVELVLPNNGLTKEECQQIALLSFPDTHSHTEHDIIFTFRQRRADGFHNGYVFFRQQRDGSLPRGFLQQSIVLLVDNVRLPLPHSFRD
jgi:hypothetical protein